MDAPDPEHVVGVRKKPVIVGVVVVLNVVVVNFRADKDMVPDVVTDTAGEVLHEVIGAAVVDATLEQRWALVE